MSSDNFPPYFAQYRFEKEQNVYKFKRISREHACEWKRFVMAAAHHKKMQTPVIGKPIMPREAKKAAQKLSDELITQEKILQAVRRMEEAYREPPKDHYVLVYPPKVVELDERAVMLDDYQHPERCIYLLGAEDHGIPPEVLNRCRDVVQIPGKVCYNVAVAGSIVMYDRAAKQRRDCNA